ncbi:hypothetical protein R8Z57_00795 [Microbacterium sp. M3]|uniref:Uncharacterized protein n=1 Tax=Microbacterium arthrosphaerae TaxID=792652 RepID=A0ABU4GW72_9MICO|nr:MULTISPECIES: hypothetical protein [Microbacterium]MDW4571311.1 hypothetical protein [Microbacterium arthrosphaerae]MDW7605166.1 hypothetical protein [Microbacterium sp. M3]
MNITDPSTCGPVPGVPGSVADDAPLDPAAMLALVDDQRRSVERQMAGFVPYIVTAWGVAWLVGFGALWLIEGLAPAFSLPASIAFSIFGVCIVGAIVVSAVFGARSGRGLRGNPGEAFTGIVYGCAWWIGSIAIVGLGQGLHANGMSADLAEIYYPVAFVSFAGIMYVLAAAIWRAVPMLVVGVWTVVVAVAAPFFGVPTQYLVLALGGGLGFLALGVASFVHLARLRGRVRRAAHR